MLRDVSGADDAAIRAAWRRHSDTGDVTGDLLSRVEGRDTDPISIRDLDHAFATIAGARVARERTALLTALLQRASPDEARYIAKLITGELRIGLREGLVEEAIAVAFGAEPAAVSRAVMLTGDLGEAALLARAGRSTRRRRAGSCRCGRCSRRPWPTPPRRWRALARTSGLKTSMTESGASSTGAAPRSRSTAAT